jgi:hypothetical protein
MALTIIPNKFKQLISKDLHKCKSLQDVADVIHAYSRQQSDFTLYKQFIKMLMGLGFQTIPYDPPMEVTFDILRGMIMAHDYNNIGKILLYLKHNKRKYAATISFLKFFHINNHGIPIIDNYQIIGLVGHAGAGKTTLSNYIHSKYGYSVRSFAEPLKETVGYLFQMTKEQLYGKYKETIISQYGKTPRKILQEVADFYKSNYGSDFWVEFLMKQITKRDKIIIDDVRMENEKRAILSRGGYLFGLNNCKYVTDGHESEQISYDWCDDIIYTNCDIKYTYQQIDELMKIVTR